MPLKQWRVPSTLSESCSLHERPDLLDRREAMQVVGAVRIVAGPVGELVLGRASRGATEHVCHG